MSSIIHIPFYELSSATNGFDREYMIASGGFGNVYKVRSDKHGIIAIKRLNPALGQGDHEFKTEIALLSEYKHENIVSLIGYCDEDGEKLLVYKYESNGSLNKHLNSNPLTWIKRLQICLGAARGLQYLHDDVGLEKRIIHRDIKSANILLDENWNAKVSDFGLSRITPANKQTTFLISNACGTFGYIDPDYLINGYLTKESDVYSFGVVLFEVLCGRPARVTNYKVKDKREFLTVLVKEHYKRQTLTKIVHLSIQDEINEASLLTFSNIAYQCLKSGQERPTMKKVVDNLQKALDNQLVSSGSLFGLGGGFSDDYDHDYADFNQEQSRPRLESSSQSIPAPPMTWKYDAYISFSGADTRNTFVSHLYSALVAKGIHTFRDEEMTWNFKENPVIASEIFKVIKESRIFIIVFSKSYASSSWCLDELALIMKTKDEGDQEVLPIFYLVNPVDVLHQIGEYGEAFNKYESENNTKVKSWREALTYAASLSGWEAKDMGEAKLIKNVVDTVSKTMLSFIPSTTASTITSANPDLIGIETRIQELKSYLAVGSGGVHMVGICGIWGSGKSTLAYSIYDNIKHWFEGCCFVENVRAESRMHGLKRLQEKILSEVMKSKVTLSNIEHGTRVMARLRHNTVLIVLDDIDHIDHLKMLAGTPDWFGEGSRIIITTRNQNLLNAHNINMTLSVRMLDFEESVKVFSKHAFMGGRLLKGYEEISRNMISKFGGHPLALIKLGSILKGRNMNEWMSILGILEGIPDDEILKIFKPVGDDGVRRDVISWMSSKLYSQKFRKNENKEG